mmetsp:Transcript_80373/g.259747  ORF Transcript_80373/g.259747 Transcript_80373/m.259747 type:complete len:90 (+) Transcript_80373:205-474(+)
MRTKDSESEEEREELQPSPQRSRLCEKGMCERGLREEAWISSIPKNIKLHVLVPPQPQQRGGSISCHVSREGTSTEDSPDKASALMSRA